MRWEWLRFEALGVERLYEVLALRGRVFVVEQGPFLDADGLDRQAWHLLGHGADARDAAAPTAYLRVVDAGAKHAEPSIGRVAVAAPLRGRGLGHALVAEGIARCTGAWPGRPIRISAQAHLERFYGRHGFARIGEPYGEDGIPHVAMVRPADRPAKAATVRATAATPTSAIGPTDAPDRGAVRAAAPGKGPCAGAIAPVGTRP